VARRALDVVLVLALTVAIEWNVWAAAAPSARRSRARAG
jgi:hypothetical protein